MNECDFQLFHFTNKWIILANQAGDHLLCFAQNILTAMDQTWHPEHFFCSHCGDLFGPDGETAADLSIKLKQLITTRMPRTSHTYILWVSRSSRHLRNDRLYWMNLSFPGFMERDGKPYCSRDFYRLFAPKCSGCGEPVKENYLSAANGTWHPDCFVCAVSELVALKAGMQFSHVTHSL